MKRFATKYRKDGVLFGGQIDALDFEHAQRLCDERGQGETVEGVLYSIIKASDTFGHKQADEMTKRFAESGDDEPPDASDFDKNDL